jgi:exosortase
MADSTASQPPSEAGFPGELARFGRWCARNPAQAALLGTLLATLFYFFGIYKVFVNGQLTAAVWAWQAWNGAPGSPPETLEQAHGNLVIPIALFLAWRARGKIRAAVKEPSNLGMVIAGFGALLFVLSARALQPRLAMVALPVIVYGGVMAVWGKQVARQILFPCAFMVFAIPFAVLEQATFRLQFVVTGSVAVLSKLVGIKIAAVGTTLTAVDGSFDFEIAEGCSGIKSLIAMTMLTAVYAHVTQREMWKKVLLFAASVPFAIIGNIGRIFTVVLVARFIDKDIAGGIYHDYSGFIFFPVALGAMMLFARLLNADFSQLKKQIMPVSAGPGETKSQTTTTPDDIY